MMLRFEVLLSDPYMLSCTKLKNYDGLLRPFGCEIRYIMDPVMLKRLTAYSTIPSPVHRRFKCSFCLYCTDISTNLKNHILTHTGEKKYRCDVCGMRFTLKHHLKKHAQLHL